MNVNQKKALYESIMKSVAKTVKCALNEAYDTEDSEDNEFDILSRMTIREKIKEFRKYVKSYYAEFPEELDNDITTGMSHINWGELGSDAGNAICAILQKDDADCTASEKSDIDLAQSIANEYLGQYI